MKYGHNFPDRDGLLNYERQLQVDAGSGGLPLGPLAHWRGYMVFEPRLLFALSVPSAASAATAKYQVPVLSPVIS
jgi:hypothetical protein